MKLLLFDSRNKKANLSAKGTTLGEDFTSENDFVSKFFFLRIMIQINRFAYSSM